MIANGEHINLVEYPETPFNAPKGAGDPDVYALIQSHLFCVDNLCDDEIRSRIAEERKFESPPVKYEGQALENPYHYWIYPNYKDGIFSKCFARVNIAGDLVIDFAGETCLVCIRYGRLTFTRQVSDDVVSVSDERLLVCL